MRKKIKKYYRLVFLVSSDILLVSLALGVASFLSDETGILSVSKTSMTILAVGIIIKISAFVRIGLYRAVLRYASIDFLTAILKGSVAGSLGLLFVLYLLKINLEPRILIIDCLMTTLMIGGSRFIVRYYHEFIIRYRKGRRVLIYGAGDLGVMALRQLRSTYAPPYVPIGFVDDDAGMDKKIIHNKPVLGVWKDLDKIIRETRVDEVVVAIAQISGDKLRKIVKDCRERGLVCRLIPSFSRVLEMEPMVRNVEISDLLRRAPRDLDVKAISEFVGGKKILITGAAGSIGSELVRQCLRHDPDDVIALDQSEEGLYHLKEEFADEDRLKFVLRDVVCKDSLDAVFRSYKPEIVFHAAAYKHVPMLEDNVEQAVVNNIAGTRNVAEVSEKHGVEKFVLISTDKAVRPSSVMGATKRVCELFIQNYNKQSSTEFVAVRFGNVLGSSGSVIPKFLEQIRAGGPVTVTHPEATRYFMLTSEAVQLVLQAAAMGDGGNIFILDMGSPVKITEMAEDLIYLMGREPYRDIKINFIGLRPGEKIYEELFTEEIESRTRYENITVARATILDWAGLSEKIESLVSLARSGEKSLAVEQLMKLVQICPISKELKVGRDRLQKQKKDFKNIRLMSDYAS